MKICGKNPVLERVKSNPTSIRLIYVVAGHPDHSYLAMKAKKFGIMVNVVSPGKLLRLAGNRNAQGVVADIGGFEHEDFGELLEEALEKRLTLVFLDGLTDPQNLGGIIRSCGCLGGFAIVLPKKDSASVNETVLRVACGGENHTRVTKVANLNNAVKKAKEKGFWIAGSVVQDGVDLAETELPFPLGLVIGSEGKGVRDVIQKNLDVRLTVPMAQPRMSLNAAHATSIFCYEINRQKKQKRKR